MAIKIAEEAERLANEIAAPMGLRVYDTEFLKEGAKKVLRIYIDKLGDYIAIDDCEAVSRALSDRLDEQDFIEDAYTLEVSSPGLERHLKRDWHFEEAVGEKVDVKLFRPLNGQKMLSGILAGGNLKEGIVLKTGDKELHIEKQSIADVKISFEF
ncbi:ribosome maturation factor RimP [Acetivibrio sp. MSJd-27]|jgi:ribosome maturation factor rimP|uniref:ribosome maturation factor RimP n=1 Tax=Acetivibrio sp. MSJd-27 TaxID=2841523 RepID=UPI0015A7C9BB|nr:ribosome maturation factor RimP [Acetivibrio sp. MSJd-27]MBU5450932.1 ribosome maturation factor RimP [Acetivibrio sp. MSJd-27]